MKRFTLNVPIKMVNGEQWGDFGVYGHTHQFCGERVDQKNDLSFAANHRVRLYAFKKNVHWKIPLGQDLNISDVQPENAPRRQGR